MKMTSRKKLLGLSIVSAVLTLAVGMAGYWGLRRVSGATAKMLQEGAQIAQHSAGIRANTLGLRRYEKDMFININALNKVGEYETKFKDQYEHLLQRIDDLKRAATLPQDTERVAQMRTDLGAYITAMTGIIGKIKAKDITTAQEGNTAVNAYKETIPRPETTAEAFAKEGKERMDQVEGVLAAKA
jgi:methyl-accepting chemotaxis protein